MSPTLPTIRPELLAGITKRYPLSVLPNREGFTFTGITHDGDLVTCQVRKNPIGMHGVYRVSDGAPCWFQLCAWEHFVPQGSAS